MRIGIDVSPLCAPRSGVGVYTQNLLHHLTQRGGHQVTPLSHDTCIGRPAAERGRWRLNRTLWMQFVLPWQLARQGFDVCHLTNGTAPVWGACPSVVTIHDMTLWLFPQFHYGSRLLAMRPFIPLAVRHARAVIAVSNSARGDLVRILGVPASKVHVIPEAAGAVFHPRAPAELSAVRQRYGLHNPFVLHVGTLEPRKNLVRLLEAFNHLLRSAAAPAGLGLLLVGRRGWKYDTLFAALERLDLKDRVRILDDVPDDDLAHIYNLAQALVFPSLYEGFGLPAVEAMASGTPVVASPRGGLAETISGAAEIIDPDDTESLMQGLARVLSDSDRRAELRALGLQRAAELSWARAADETLRVYAEAIG